MTEASQSGASQSEPTVESQTIFEGKILKVRVDTVRLPNGRLATREVVEHSNSVGLRYWRTSSTLFSSSTGTMHTELECSTTSRV